MTVYHVVAQVNDDERVFLLKDVNGDLFQVDIFTDGGTGLKDDAAEEEYKEHLKSFVGKYIEVPELLNWRYFSHGKVSTVKGFDA